MPDNDKSKRRVIFVDDEQSILNNIKLNLEDDFDIATFDNPNEALKHIENDNLLKVVVSDQKMGNNMEGTEFLAHVWRLRPDVVRIILTGFAEYEIAYKAIKNGRVFDFVVKKGDYIEAVKVSINKAIEWHAAQFEIGKLREFMKQFGKI